MCKKFKFDHKNQWHMNNVRENETLKLLCDFEIQKTQLISARLSDLVIINKKKKEKKKKERKELAE